MGSVSYGSLRLGGGEGVSWGCFLVVEDLVVGGFRGSGPWFVNLGWVHRWLMFTPATCFA